MKLIVRRDDYYKVGKFFRHKIFYWHLVVRRDDYYKVGKFFRHKIFYWHLVYTAMLDCLKKFNFGMMDVLLLLLLLLSI